MRTCIALGCQEVVPCAALACREHWRHLPPSLQRTLTQVYAGGRVADVVLYVQLREQADGIWERQGQARKVTETQRVRNRLRAAHLDEARRLVQWLCVRDTPRPFTVVATSSGRYAQADEVLEAWQADRADFPNGR